MTLRRAPTVRNADITDTFNQLADLLEIEEANRLRVQAYRRAAMTVAELPASVADMIAAGSDLTELPGIGDDLAGKMQEIVETGELKLLKQVEARTPSTLAALTAIPGLGPKRVHALHVTLDVNTVEQLAAAAAAGKVRGLPRFSPALEARILAEAKRKLQAQPRFSPATVEEYANILLAWLRRAPGLGEVALAGSYRRRKETSATSTSWPQALIPRPRSSITSLSGQSPPKGRRARLSSWRADFMSICG